MRNKKITVLAECAVMVALAFALSCAKLFEMPLGGSITVASMLPIMLISIKYGNAIGLGSAFVYSVTQVLQALAEGNVFPYCETAGTLLLCVFFDYLVPFTLLGLSGMFMKWGKIRHTEIRAYLGIVSVVVLRFLSHFITGVAIWGQWAPDGMGKYLYSFLYNGGFLSLDFLICIAVAVLMFRKSEIRKLVELDKYAKESV
ncbi:MAG: energy-coupled thiamine transporter ThiT [Clostridia bacterium]|nr:energy-coupled thiamine transporter ThiT [Clostridia bacterium]